MRSCWDVCHQIIRNEAKKARNVPNCGKHKTEQREERENVKRVRSLSNRTKECVCGKNMNGKRTGPVTARKRILDSQLPVDPTTPIRAAL